MASKVTVLVGVCLILVGIGFGVAAYHAQKRALDAEQKTLRLPPGFRGPLTRDTPVTVELFGPNRRAADRAASTRNTLLIACAIGSLSGAVVIVTSLIGIRRKKGDGKDSQSEAPRTKDTRLPTDG